MNRVGQNYEFIASLPPSKEPWKIHAFDHGVIVVNPEHPARFIRRDGTIDILACPADVPDAIKIQSSCITKNSVAVSALKFFNRGGVS